MPATSYDYRTQTYTTRSPSSRGQSAAAADVLEAAHIVPVEYGGADTVGNGLCLRRDIHRLFDWGHLRISAEGALMLSSAAKNSVSYAHLPNVVELPAFVNLPSVAWRLNYL